MQVNYQTLTIKAHEAAILANVTKRVTFLFTRLGGKDAPDSLHVRLWDELHVHRPTGKGISVVFTIPLHDTSLLQ